MEKQILQYTIIVSEYSHEIAKEVNEWIEKGWQPYGDLVKADIKGYLYQPMVRYEGYA